VTLRALLAWAMFVASTVAEPVCMLLWYLDKITTRQMVGLTLFLGLVALQFSAVTTLYVV
jgi:hypothetical protein